MEVREQETQVFSDEAKAIFNNLYEAGEIKPGTQGSGKTTMLKACVQTLHEFLNDDSKKEASVNILNRSHHRPLEAVGFITENLCTGKRDKDGIPLFAGDVIENENGLRFEIRFGEFAMYCPVDDCMMENVGFFCVADGYYEDMPLGPTEQYSKKIGNIYDNPKLAVAAEYRCQAECELQENSIYGNTVSEFHKCGLTSREIEVVKLLAKGMSNKDISKKLKITERTTKNHMHSIFKKTKCKDRTQVAIWAVKIQL
ncbi:MAG: LuxR C-terminal-related transcriptional regulator [Lachnospiraceae bacterium]|nr:LuxR C-terminal-related transcriptional regulator [Lachnospiraceae bacterium]